MLGAVEERLAGFLFGPGEGPERRRCPACGEGELELRLGRYGPIVGCRRHPACGFLRRLAPGYDDEDDIVGPKHLGTEPGSGLAITLRRGPNGYYVQKGEGGGKEKPPRMSVPKAMAACLCRAKGLQGLDCVTFVWRVQLGRAAGSRFLPPLPRALLRRLSEEALVIDVCNAKPIEPVEEALMATMAKSERGISGNFQQKKFPVNPISYMNDRGISSIFRYVQTHPDMDHMDGIEALFHEFSPTNFWDTGNTKEMQASSGEGSPYRASDWKFYKHLRDTDPDEDPRRLTLYSGARGPFYNQGRDGAGGVMGSTFSRPQRNSLPRRMKLTRTTTAAPT